MRPSGRCLYALQCCLLWWGCAMSHSDSASPTPCLENTCMDITDDVIPQFVVHIVSSLRWTSVNVIMDTSEDIGFWPDQAVQWMLFQPPNATTNGSGAGQWLNSISALQPPINVVLLGRPDFIRRTLTAVVTLSESSFLNFRWLTAVPSDDFVSVVNVAKSFDHVALVVKHPSNQVTLETLVREGDRMNTAFVTKWSPCQTSRPEVTESSVFPNLNRGLGGRTLKALTKEWEPFVIRHQNETHEWFTGYCIDVLDILAKALNFTYRLREDQGRVWGAKVKGRWEGLTGALHRKEADLAIAGLSVTPERATVSDYTTGFYDDSHVMITRLPDPTPIGWTFFLRPFHWLVYALLGLSLLFTTVLLVCVERLAGRAARAGGSDRRTPYIARSGTRALETMFGVLIARAVPYDGLSSSGRALLSAWLLFSLVTVATYTGQLISNSLLVQQSVPFTSVKELTRRSDYRWGFTVGTMVETTLAASSNPDFRRYYEMARKFGVEDPDLVSTRFLDVLPKVLEGNYVHIASMTYYDSLKAKHCQLTYVHERILQDSYAIHLQKGSPYKDMFNEVLTTASELGLLQYLKRKWLPDQAETCTDDGAEVRPVTVDLVKSALTLAAGGLAASAILLWLERLVHSWRC